MRHGKSAVGYAWGGGLVLILAAACSSAQNVGGPAMMGQVVGTSGGTVTADDGTKIVIPAGALATDVTITVAPNPQAPAVNGASEVGTAHLFGPEGQQFLMPIEVTLPFDPSSVPLGVATTSLVVFTAPQGSSAYVALPTSVTDSSHLTAQTTHFCNLVPAYPMQAGAPDAGSDGGSVGKDGSMGPGDGSSPPSDATSPADGSVGPCSAGAPCSPGSACGGPGFSCSCQSGALVCSGTDGGGGPDAGACLQGAACSPGSACGGPGFSCSCQSGALACSGTDGGGPDAGACLQGAPCSAGSACGGPGFSCSCQSGALVCSGNGLDGGGPD